MLLFLLLHLLILLNFNNSPFLLKISEKNVTTPATVKAVEEVCVTCGSNHNFNNCPLTRNESLLNSDPSPSLNQGDYLPEIRKELKVCKCTES
ncbi:hypothetical protein Tco_0297023, partial [Tanacetum coccineum]